MITQLEQRLTPDPSRVVVRPFHIAPEPRDLNPVDLDRARRIFGAVAALDQAACERELTAVNIDFADRHWETSALFAERSAMICAAIGAECQTLSRAHLELVGAYFCMEYAYCAAAVTNPSIVPHPDQSGIRDGDVRFILSLRTVGEGHISSISFREGVFTQENALLVGRQSGPTLTPDVAGPDAEGEIALTRRGSVPISAMVIFPVTVAQRNGLEDLRMVAFAEPDGTTTYHGTYTAYSGTGVRCELFSTRDFKHLTLRPLRGSATGAKGLALFPRLIDGRYAMLGRHDGESHFLLFSDDLLCWDLGERIAGPEHLWELVQTGNCGSPIETAAGWLVLCHGVGAMRKYAIGAMLLDLDDPARVLARSNAPFLLPGPVGRDGYVPNVVYTCGALLKGERLLIPYGVADTSVAFAHVDLSELLASLS